MPRYLAFVRCLDTGNWDLKNVKERKKERWWQLVKERKKQTNKPTKWGGLVKERMNEC